MHKKVAISFCVITLLFGSAARSEEKLKLPPESYFPSPVFLSHKSYQSLSVVWEYGRQFSDLAKSAVLNMAKPNFSKVALDYDVFSNFSFQVHNANLPLEYQNTSLFNLMAGKVNDLLAVMRENKELSYNDPVFLRDIYTVIVGIYFFLEVAKTVEIGKSRDIEDLETFTFDKVLDFRSRITPRDPYFSGIYIQYLKARHFGFPHNYLYDLGQALVQMSYQFRFHYENAEEQAYGFELAAVNVFAQAATKGNPDRDNDGFGSFFGWDKLFSVSAGASLAQKNNLKDIEFDLEKIRLKHARDTGSQAQVDASMKRLIELSLETRNDLSCLQKVTLWIEKNFRKSLELKLAFLTFILGVAFCWVAYANSSLQIGFAKRIWRGGGEIIGRIFATQEVPTHWSERLLIAIASVVLMLGLQCFKEAGQVVIDSFWI